MAHILRDCDVKILVTSSDRLKSLAPVLDDCSALQHVVLVDGTTEHSAQNGIVRMPWAQFLDLATSERERRRPRIDGDMAAILYTSGSTGNPKGVVISHRNIVAGAASVVDYLDISHTDRLLAVLPFSFDYGLNQLISSMLAGASCVLLDYLLPKDVIKALEVEEISGLAAVPPLWSQLSRLEWPKSIQNTLRYMTNSGGKMPRAVLDAIRQKAPKSQFFLMYGLTEAFRSTFLPPAQIDARPDSIGKAIPNAEILVINKDGQACKPNEPGELVHRGVHVAMGYWNDPAKTAERFKPSPTQITEIPVTEIAVWSGDTVIADEEGYLYFVGRDDDMIKTSGYRVSPTELEEAAFASGAVSEAAAIGIPDSSLGERIVIVAKPSAENPDTEKQLLRYFRQELPNYMLPSRVVCKTSCRARQMGKSTARRLSKRCKPRSTRSSAGKSPVWSDKHKIPDSFTQDLGRQVL